MKKVSFFFVSAIMLTTTSSWAIGIGVYGTGVPFGGVSWGQEGILEPLGDRPAFVVELIVLDELHGQDALVLDEVAVSLLGRGLSLGRLLCGGLRARPPLRSLRERR